MMKLFPLKRKTKLRHFFNNFPTQFFFADGKKSSNQDLNLQYEINNKNHNYFSNSNSFMGIKLANEFHTSPLNESLNYFKSNENEIIPLSNLENLNTYTIEILNFLKVEGLTKIQNEIFDDIAKDSHSLILADQYVGRHFCILMGIINRVLNNKRSNLTKNSIQFDEYFENTEKDFDDIRRRSQRNIKKKYFLPKGALIISPKFEFGTQIYKLLRKLDYKKKLNLSRIGTTLQNITSVIEHLDNEDSNESEIEEICKMNLLLNTQWKLNDILCISPIMLQFVMNNLDPYDKYDINPEIIYFDDYDYIFGKRGEFQSIARKVIHKYFSPQSDFYNEYTKERKLILSTTTSDLVDELKDYFYFVQKIPNSNCKSENYLHIHNSHLQKILGNKIESGNQEFISLSKILKMDLEEIIRKFIGEDKFTFVNQITSKNFMNFNQFRRSNDMEEQLQNIKGIKFNYEYCNDGVFEKRLRKILNIASNLDLTNSFIICVNNDKSLKNLKDAFNKRKIKFLCMEKDSKVNDRLACTVLFNQKKYNILLCSLNLLKGLNFTRVENLVIFDIFDDIRDWFKILSKFRLSIESRNNCKFPII